MIKNCRCSWEGEEEKREEFKNSREIRVCGLYMQREYF